MFSVSSRTSAKTGVAPQWTITLAVAGQVSERRDHLVARTDAERDQRQVQRRGAGRDREHVLHLEVLAHARLELRRRAARWSASRSGSSRRRRRPPPRRRRAAGREERRAARHFHARRVTRAPTGELRARAVSTRKRIAWPPRSARASASSRLSPTTSTAPARSVPRRSGGDVEARLPVDPHAPTPSSSSGTSTDREHPGRGDQEARDGAADQPARAARPPRLARARRRSRGR